MSDSKRTSGAHGLWCALFTGLLGLLLWNPLPATAQVLYGSLVGTVTDASGAAVPGATVKATQVDTNETREIATNELGLYTLSTLPAGVYDVSVSKQGFRTSTAQKIQVRVNAVVRVDAALQLGAVSESVEVTAQAAALQTDRADVRAEFSSQQFVNIPQPTRTYQGVLALMPGVAPPSASGGGQNNPGKSMQFQTNGTSRSGTNVRIDGVSATNPWVQFFSSAVPSIEAIETVNVVTTSADAEQGMTNGAAINVQMKSGTNAFHGSGYEYHINSAWKSRPFFLPANQGIPKLVDNNFGGTLGGRIIRDKLFFFGNYEASLIRQGAAQTITVPTAAIRAGDMSASPNQIYDPATGNADGSGRTPFADKIVPNSRISPIVQKIVALVPQQNLAGLTNNYYVNTPQANSLHKLDGKVDWNATPKFRIASRVSNQPYHVINTTIYGDTLGGSPDHDMWGGVFSTSTTATYVASPTLVIDALWGFTWAHQWDSPPATDKKWGADVLGIPGVNIMPLPYGGGMPQFNVSSYNRYGYNYTYLENKDPVFQYTGNVSWIKRSHNIRFGFDLSQQKMDHAEVAPDNFTFSGGVTTVRGGPGPNQFNSYADFLLGLPVSHASSYMSEPWITLRTWQHSLYIRDQWQVSRKLTLSLGTRWEYYPIPKRANRQLELYDLATDKYLICGVGSTPDNCGITVSKKLFSPRVGIAFRPMGSFVIRTGYALNPEQINMARDTIANYPGRIDYNASSLNSYVTVAPLAQGIPRVPAPDFSSGSIPLPAGATFTTVPRNFVRGYTQSWNFTLQKEFGGWVAQAGYVGTKTDHQHTRYNVNYGQPGGGAASQPFFKKFGITGAETVILPIEAMRYHALQTTLNRQFAKGVTFQAAYTFSKWTGLCCDDSGDGQPQIPIPEYSRLNRALMSADRTHNLRISGIAELPFGKGKPWLNNGAAARVAGGWQINSVFSSYSGSPFTVSASGASLNAPGVQTQRADQVKPNVQKLGGIRDTAFFDPLAFAPVTDVRFGTSGYNTMRGPGVVNLDLGIFREFRMTERFRLQFRAEAMNATNTPHFSNPGANVSNLQLNPDGSVRALGGFAQVTGVSAPSRLTDERYLRLGLRIAF